MVFIDYQRPGPIIIFIPIFVVADHLEMDFVSRLHGLVGSDKHGHHTTDGELAGLNDQAVRGQRL
ncbi:hypothetical protein D3C76_969860 [compost metagenome]